jgi:hypothetical protein
VFAFLPQKPYTPRHVVLASYVRRSPFFFLPAPGAPDDPKNFLETRCYFPRPPVHVAAAEPDVAKEKS